METNEKVGTPRTGPWRHGGMEGHSAREPLPTLREEGDFIVEGGAASTYIVN
jgi:hypothetical protein